MAGGLVHGLTHRLRLGFYVLLSFGCFLPAWANDDPQALFADCEASFAAEPEGWYACGCFYAVGMGQGRRDEAARRLALHLAADPLDACLQFDLGRLRMLDGDPRAVELLRTAAEGFGVDGAVDGEVYARINLGRFLHARGDEGIASDELEAARRVAVDAPGLLAQVELEQARLRLSRGDDLEQVERHLIGLSNRVSGLAKPSLQRDTLQALGNVRFQLGRFAAAERTYREMAQATQAAGDLYGEASARHGEVVARMARGPGANKPEVVGTSLLKALEMAIAAQQRLAEADLRIRLGKFLGGEDGEEQLRAAVALAQSLDSPDLMARSSAALAAVLVERSPDQAQQLAEQSFRFTQESPYFDVAAHGWSDRQHVAWATQSPSEALLEGLATLAKIETFRDRQRSAGGRSQVFAPWTEAYYALSGRLLEAAGGDRSNLAQAFAIVERMRARVLLETLSSSRGSSGEPLQGPEPVRLEQLEARRVQINRQLIDPELSESRRGAALDELDRLETELDELRAMRLGFGALLEAPEAADLATLDQVVDHLADDEALFSFQLAPRRDIYGGFAGGSWLVVVTAQGGRAYPLLDATHLGPMMRIFLNLFVRRDGSQEQPARRLFDELVGPALADLPPDIDRLVIVADGPLHGLPFAALRDSEGQPLLARYRVSRAPSATLWRHWRELTGRSSSGLASSGRILAFADPLPSGAPAVGSAAERSWPLAVGVRLEALPHARREGRAAVRFLASGELLIGDAASESALETPGDEPLSLVHFATHAVIDTERPRRSAVVLAAGDVGEDGLLQPDEIAALDLEGAVVVLSTCSSARGPVLAGEGPASLARAFFEAGATTVVASLWPLRDDEAARLFERFYRHLASGATVAEALVEAQREQLAKGVDDADWAGVVLLGDGTATFKPRAVSGIVWHRVGLLSLLGVGVLSLLVVAGFQRRRRRRAKP